MRVGLAGYTGFVGGYLYEAFPDAETFNSTNLSSVAGRSFDLFLCACVPAVKWRANAEPEQDLAAVLQIQGSLHGVRACSVFVLISTIDVEACAREPYGKHRLLMEEWCLKRFDDARVIRLPALFGLGLKKNILFDLLNARLLDKIDPRSVFQWYDMRWLKGDVEHVLSSGAKLAKCYSDPVETRAIIDELFPEVSVGHPDADSKQPVQYRFQASEPRFARGGEEVLRAIREFASMYRATRDPVVRRLAVSNLCWDSPRHDRVAGMVLKKFNVSKVELAPSLYGDLDDDLILPRDDWTPVSFQAILHGIPAFDPTTVAERIRKVARLARSSGVGVLVLGSPTLRGDPAHRRAWMRLLIELELEGVRLCVEPNSTSYGCRIGTRVAEVVDLIGERPGLFLNFDTGNAWMESDAPTAEQERRIAHVQVSAPFLGNLTRGLERSYVDAGYGDVARRAIDNGSHVSLEIKGNVQDLSDNLWNFIEFIAASSPAQK
jgi:hypothetical protein